MEFKTFTGKVSNNRKGREPSKETLQLTAAIQEALTTRKPVVLSGIPDGDKTKLIARLRNLAMKMKLSLSLGWADNGDPVFSVTPKDGIAPAVSAITTPAKPTKKSTPPAPPAESPPTAPTSSQSRKPRKTAVKAVGKSVGA